MLFLTDKQNVLVPSHNRLETAGLDPELICGSSGLCLSPCLLCLGPRCGQRLLTPRAVSPPVPLLSLWGREAPTAPGAAQVSSSFVLSRVIAPGLTQGSDSPSLPSHPPQLLGWPLQGTMAPPVLPGPTAAQGECCRQKRSWICLRGAVGRAAPQWLPWVSCTPQLCPSPTLQGQGPECLHCTSLCCSSSWPGKCTPQF